MSALLAGAPAIGAGQALAAACTPITAGGGSTTSPGMTGALSHAFGGSSAGTATTAYRSKVPACTVPVPNLLRMTPAEAARKLKAGRLGMTVAGRIDSRETVDRIARQSPAAGTKVACGCDVSVVVAQARAAVDPAPLVTVPDVETQPLERAIAVLKRAPLSVEVSGPSRFDGVPGVVARQFPAAGQRVRLGSVVTLRLEPAGVVVPPLLDKTPEAARLLVKKAGLRWTVQDKRPSDRTQDSVVAQTPRAGTLVRAGSRVAVTIALARAMVQVPDVTTATPDEALGDLSGERLVGRVVERVPGDDAVARVVGQTPPPGTWVPVDSTVRLAVSEARVLAEVPAVTGLDPAAASSAIAGAELVMRVIERRPSELPEDRVARQWPAEGTRVPPGSAVEIVIDLARVLPPLVEVPAVTGLHPDAASGMIADAELVMRVADRRPSELAEDRVARQWPAPGTRVPLGTAVEVAVDLARVLPPLTELPDAALPESPPAPPEAPPRATSPERPAPPPVVEPPTVPPVQTLPWRDWIAPLLRPESLRFAALLLLFMLVSLAVREARKRRKKRPESGRAALPRVEAHADAGVQQVEMQADDVRRPEIRLRPVSDAGIQSLELQQPDLFEEERRYA